MTPARIGLAFAIVTALALSTAGRAADRPKDEPALRDRALALNNVTGEEPLKGEIKELLADTKGTRKLIAVAVEMAREKNQPFNYNGAYILGTVSLALKEPEAARTFYQVCAEHAGKLQSPQKLLQSYFGLMNVIDLLYRERKYEKSGQLAQQFLEMLEKKGVPAPLKIEAIRRMDRALVKQGKKSEATKLVDNLVKARPKDWRFLELKAAHEALLGNESEATKLYLDVLSRVENDDALEKTEKDEKLAEIRQDLMDSYTRQGKVDEALKQLDQLARGQSNNWVIRDFKAQIQWLGGQLTDAAKSYEALLAQIGKDDHLAAPQKQALEKKWRYILSGIYIDLDQVDRAAAELKTLLEREPDNPTYNNDLGYIWADHDKNLDQAERMIRKALEEDRKQRKENENLSPGEDKDNAAYVDSLGWVLFKKKNYKEAKKYLLEAVKGDDPQHIEIMDHLADVHMALGEKAEAIAVWKKSLTLEATTKREKDRKALVEKKLKALEEKDVTRKP
jgi:Flp pilus assembly protein TadD